MQSGVLLQGVVNNPGFYLSLGLLKATHTYSAAIIPTSLQQTEEVFHTTRKTSDTVGSFMGTLPPGSPALGTSLMTDGKAHAIVAMLGSLCG